MTAGMAAERFLDALHAAGCPPRKSGRGWSARCPAHEDRNPSLSVTPIEGQVLIYCHAGCDADAVLDAIHLTRRDLFDEPRGNRLASYEYRNLAGAVARTVYRTADKQFPQDVVDKAPILYRLAAVTAATAAGTVVYLVEGEKDVHALESLGLVATTAPMGAKNFVHADVSPLKGARVVAVVDRDGPGAKWAALVRERLDGYATSLTLVEAKQGKDAADHIAAGLGAADFTPFEFAAEQEEKVRTLLAVPASSITMKAPRWLYDRRIPAGAITLLAGREGIGKSTISYDITARLTRGELPGRYQGQPRSVGVVASEDSWESVILPRLVAARADLDRVFRVEARTEEGQYETISAPADLVDLAKLCRAQTIVLVVVDPIMSIIHASLDTHKDREVRQALDPLARFCSTNDVSTLALIHVNKSNDTDPLNSVMGSRAFSAVARSVLYCMADPEAEQEDRYLFGHPKSNLGPKQPTLTYHLVETKLELEERADPFDAPDDDGVILTSRVVWDGVDTRSIREAMETPRPKGEAGELATRILDWMTKQGRTVPAAELAEEFADVKRATLDQNLARMVKRGTLTRPMFGHYAMPHQSDTPLETSEVSEVSELSEDLGRGNGAVTDSDTSDGSDGLTGTGRVSEPVSEPFPDWTEGLWDR